MYRALAKADAEKISIPHILLASNGEDPEVVKEYKAIIEGEGKPGVVGAPPSTFILTVLYPKNKIES